MKAPTERFSDRVEDYVKYRPSYPPAVVECLQAECGLHRGSIVADVGAGTGIFTEFLLRIGGEVFAVEPNEAMRQAAERRLGSHPRFHSVAGTAECTGLDAAAVDLITAAQAFHWFRRDETRREFRRILRSGGRVALVWNERKTDDAFQQGYEALLRRHAPEYEKVNHRTITDDDIATFLGGGELRRWTFPNDQRLDFAGLRGRMQSASYTPRPGERGHRDLLASLEALFKTHAVGGKVAFAYETRLHLGRLADGAPNAGSVAPACGDP